MLDYETPYFRLLPYDTPCFLTSLSSPPNLHRRYTHYETPYCRLMGYETPYFSINAFHYETPFYFLTVVCAVYAINNGKSLDFQKSKLLSSLLNMNSSNSSVN